MNHFYPGMGATSSMYGELWRKEFEGQFHDWPKWRDERSLTDIAVIIIEEHRIEAGDTLIGTSLGGIVACEVANLLDLERIVLIGSAQRKEEINGILSILHPLIDLAPIAFIQMSSGKLPSDLAGMFSHSDPSFIRNMSKAIFSWNGLQSEVPVLRIHGTKDLVIPHPHETDHDIDGGHLIVMTHPLECIRPIREIQSQLSTPFARSSLQSR
jgi:pimeloyl-ACP methyl ester carboxylesterase